MQYIRFYLIIVLLFITVCVGFANYKYFKDRYLKYFFYFMCYTFLGEIVSLIMINTGYGNETTMVYNLYTVVLPVFMAFFFRHYMKSKTFRNLSRGMIGLFLIGVVINSIFYQSFVSSIQSNIWIFSDLTVAIVVILYLVDILRTDAILKFKQLPQFWIAFGFFLGSLCSIPVTVIGNFIEWTGVFDYLMLLGNVLNVVGIIKGFLVARENYKSESSNLDKVTLE